MQTLVWPNGADFDPATLHDWPLYAAALAARAQECELTKKREVESLIEAGGVFPMKLFDQDFSAADAMIQALAEMKAAPTK